MNFEENLLDYQEKIAKLDAKIAKLDELKERVRKVKSIAELNIIDRELEEIKASGD